MLCPPRPCLKHNFCVVGVCFVYDIIVDFSLGVKDKTELCYTFLSAPLCLYVSFQADLDVSGVKLHFKECLGTNEPFTLCPHPVR